MEMKNIGVFSLVFIANIFVGFLLISLLATVFSAFTGINVMSIILFSIPIILISLLCYVSFKYFEISKTKMLISTIIISLIVSLGCFATFYIFKYLVGSIAIAGVMPGDGGFNGASGFNSFLEIFNFDSKTPIVITIISILFYNVLSLIDLKRED